MTERTSADGYTPREALDLLLQKVNSNSESLADQIQLAIDAGKDIVEEAPTAGRQKKPRRYRRTVPLSEEEALHMALRVLKNYFVEHPSFAVSTMDNFKAAGLDPRPRAMNKPEGPVELREIGADKALEIEIGAETRIANLMPQSYRMPRFEQSVIDEQQRHIHRLFGLLSFEPE